MAEALTPAIECRERDGLPNALAKLKAGETVRVAYFGGSITAQDGWRPKTLNWLRAQYPAAKIEEINAAIGGTGSDLGVFRLRHDVLEHRPDLLFVEFAVNDGGAAPEQIHRCMEGIVRQTWRANPATDICYVYTVAGDMLKTLQAGSFPRSATAMEQVANHYGIPSIHLGLEVARLEKAGRLIYSGALPKTDAEKAALGGKMVFSPDAVHPYPETGHQLYLEAVQRALAKIKTVGKPGAHPLPPPLVADNWERAQMLPLSQAKLSAGWRRLTAADSLAQSFGGRLPEVWSARQPGETLEFRFRGVTAKIYDLVGPDCGQVTVVVDGQAPVIRPRFDAFCTYHRLATLAVAEGLSNTSHTVKITIHPSQPDKVKILAERQEKMDDPKRFDGTQWCAGALLIVGELEP
jgi:lysophospholipase L1-like esterase